MLSGHCGVCSALASLADTNFVGNNLSGPFIVDFVCLEARLVVEIDGGQHNEEEGKAYDESRSQWLQQDGFRVLRFGITKY